MRLIPLTGRYGIGKFAKVSDKDYEHLSRFSWRVSPKGYVVRSSYKETKRIGMIRMHREVLQLGGYDWQSGGDHRNGDKLDNQRKNLRHCSQANNVRNTKVYKNSKSGFKGVRWYAGKRLQGWRASIVVDGKRYRLGVFPTKELAAGAYNKAAEKYFGEFARPNIIPTMEEA